MINIDLLIEHATQVVTCASPAGPKRGAAMREVGIITDGAVAIADGQIVAVGPTRHLHGRYAPRQRLDASGKLICPGFVDCHTHAVYAGDRAHEFELRIQGASYMEIMAAGGGIASTTRATRTATVDQLVALTRPRLDAMLALGTTTIEIKSGYGLDPTSEINLLEAIARLAAEHPADLVPTFLGAHAVPPEFVNQPNGYIDLVVEEMIPAAAAWFAQRQATWGQQPDQRIEPLIPRALFCDVFCEAGVFDRGQSQRVLLAGQQQGMVAKIHADEFKSLGGSTLAVEVGAVSADHLDVTPLAEIAQLAAANTVAVLLPAVNFNLGSVHFANARAFLQAGAVVALATDLNPGSAPCYAMPLIMAIACRYQKLTPAEALNAATINAAHAIGLGDRVGSLEVGKQADVLLVNAPDYRHLAYQFGINLVEQVIKRGQVI